jgi:ribonuclease BN (tRNA processing enzyme)
MHVTIVGSGDAFGSGGRLQTCIAVARSDGDPPTVLLDCGSSSLVGLRRLHLDPNMIDSVVLTHLHGDHFGGLPFLILDGQFRHRTHDLTVYGPAGTQSRLRQALEVFFPGSSGVARRFDVHVVDHSDRQPHRLDWLSAIPVEVRHAAGAPSYAVRLEAEGAVMAYSGDTEWTEDLLAAADAADLFLCEGYSPAPRRWHLDLDTLAHQRSRLTCRRLVLTHLAAAALGSDLSAWEVAHDGWQVTL